MKPSSNMNLWLHSIDLFANISVSRLQEAVHKLPVVNVPVPNNHSFQVLLLHISINLSTF